MQGNVVMGPTDRTQNTRTRGGIDEDAAQATERGPARRELGRPVGGARAPAAASAFAEPVDDERPLL